MAKAFVVKLGIYTLVFTYILLDLFVFHGPLKSAVEKRSGGGGKIVTQMQEKLVAAYVYRQPVYLSQVDYRVTERLAMMGLNPDLLTKKQLTFFRKKAVVELVDRALFRLKVDGNESDVPVTKDAVLSATVRFKNRFLNQGILENELEQANIEGEQEMRLRSEAMLQQDLYLKAKLDPSIVINDSTVKEFYKKHYRASELEFDEVKEEIKDALRADLMAKQLETYRIQLRAFAGVIHRHLDSSKDTKSLKGNVDCRVEFFYEIFEQPFSLSM